MATLISENTCVLFEGSCMSDVTGIWTFLTQHSPLSHPHDQRLMRVRHKTRNLPPLISMPSFKHIPYGCHYRSTDKTKIPLGNNNK